MFDDVRSVDELVADVVEAQREVSAAQARLVLRVRRLLHRRPGLSVAWLAARLDVSHGTTRDLMEAAVRTPPKSEAMARFESGEWSFDRTAAVAHLVGAKADPETLQEADERDIAGIYKLRAHQRRVTRRSEQEAHQRRSLRSWVSLDESVGFIHAELTGYDWRVVTKALDDRSDSLPRDAGTLTAEQRRADALVALCQDSFDGITSHSKKASGPVVTVIVDAAAADRTNGEAGVSVTAGPRVGPETLDQIMCAGSVEVLVDQGGGIPLAVGPTTRVIPPKLRRFVLARDGGCVIDGCTSGYRLEVHHIVPRSHGGSSHDPDNLVTLCWWHHHVALHRHGMRIDPHSPPHRRRLIPTPNTTRAPPDR